MFGPKNNNIRFIGFTVVHFGLIIDFRMWWYTARQPHIPSHHAMVADHSIPSQNGGPRIHYHMILERWMSFPGSIILTDAQST